MDLNKAIKKRRAELARFDAMNADEQRAATERGENPHDKPAERKRKKAAYLERRKREFDALPKEKREVMERLGVSPYQKDTIICRSTSFFETNGTFVVDK